jgi:hypothetical protein
MLIGARPVRLEIVVKRFTVPSVASRILIGGDPDMAASATLVDARTGAVILSNPEIFAAVLWSRHSRHCRAGGHRQQDSRG